MTANDDGTDAPPGPDATGAERDDAADDAGGGESGAGEASPGAEPRRRRRRRRRRSEMAVGGEPGAAAGEHGTPPSGDAAPPSGDTSADGDRPARSRDDRGSGHGRDGRGGGEPRSPQRGGEPRGPQHGGEPRGQQRGGEPRGQQRGGEPRGGEPRGDRGHEARARGGEAPPAARGAEPDAQHERYALLTSTFEGATTRLDPRRPVAPTDDLDLEGTTTPSIPWGKDDDGPPAEVVLAPDLPADAPPDDLDPLTYPLLELPSAPLGDDIASVAGVRFVPGGRVQWCDAGDADYARGERVMVDAERGLRLAWIAVPPARRAMRERGLRRVIRRASEQDLRGERDHDADRAQALRIAKDKAAALHLPLKVFRVEVLGQLGRGARLNIYYTTDERLDLRDFIREVSGALGSGRIELRQLGVRDEAKAVGGIGSCGLTLCCTTWLPDFVPVSIKMAKDQGLVLSPTKVSGQCGRLKCCLVYEQAGYAELRKGLPKLGKRVIGARGEGRVVEVDVLRQRVRVSYGPGDTEVVPATDVKPLFPSGNQPAARRAEAPEPEADADGDADDDPRDAGDSLELPASLGGMVDPSLDTAVLDDDATDAPTGALPDDDPS